LEPAVPKLDDKTGTDWINFKASQFRNKTNPSQGDGLKSAFEHDLAVIQKRESQKLQQKTQDMGSAASGGDSSRAKPFTFNPNAKDFSFNPGATSFTPTAAGGGGGATPVATAGRSQADAPAKSSGPTFTVFAMNSKFGDCPLETFLDGFAERSNFNSKNHLSALKEDTSWSEATGPSFHDILGQPNPMMPIGQLSSSTMPGQWQQQPGMGQMGAPAGQAPGQAGAQPQMMVQQGGPGQAGNPQMMGQQGFMMAQAPGGQPQQMFQPMYPAPAGAAPMQPPGGKGGQMPAQQGQQMAFNQQVQQMMPGPGGQQMAMPGNMVQGGQNMPKFGGMPGNMPGNMVMMVPAGQGMPQGMMVPQGMPAQPGQPGQPAQESPGGGPQMMQQRPMQFQGQMPSGQQMGGGPMPDHNG